MAIGGNYMIFYFSGTGNSLYAAQKLHESEGGELINVSDAIKEKRFKYKVKAGEKVGIVFPVYYFAVPTVLCEFIDKLEIESSARPFVYTVVTYGGFTGNADKMMGNLLKQRNLQLNSAFSIKMPGNHVMWFNVPDKKKKLDLTLHRAEEQIVKIAGLLGNNKEGDFVSNRGYFAPLTPLSYKMSGIFRKTKKFYATDACTSCGLCEKICPSETIRLTSGKPEWIKEKCCRCTACINRCPTKAIQYGCSTKKRGRYVNPNVKFSGI
jgi:Dissimilatory sulfite reductase (desulfoviridin), alpha and beta subunits